MQTQAALQRESTTNGAVLNIAFELSNKTWKLAASDGNRDKFKTIDARNLEALEKTIAWFKEKLGLGEEVLVRTCYEAGRDGFWLDRYLKEAGIENLVVDAGSIEVPRRKRRSKTDQIDAKNLLRLLMRYHGGDKKTWSVVRVPSVEAEDARRLHRELEELGEEKTRHTNRIRSLLITQGIDVKVGRGFPELFEAIELWDGTGLKEGLKGEIEREYKRLELVKEQIRELERKRQALVKAAEDEAVRKVRRLQQLKGIGVHGAWVLTMESFGWRNFQNRREVGGSAGLTGTPYDSGESEKEQGISKAGNGRVRKLMVQLAWCWLQHQPRSKLSRWFFRRFSQGGKRMRRVGIVALARKLLIALWNFVERGIVPERALLKASI